MSFFSVSTQPYGFNNKLFCQRTSILQTMTMNQTHTRQQNCFKKSNLKQKLKYPIPNYVTQIMLKLKKSYLNPNLKIPNTKSLLSNETTSKLIYGTSTSCKTILQQLISRTTSLQEQGTSENREIERIERIGDTLQHLTMQQHTHASSAPHALPISTPHTYTPTHS